MNKIPVILIYDVGKTNKKIFLFDERYNIIHEETKQLREIKDEDGFSCEDVNTLTGWIKNSFALFARHERFEIKAVNFSGYGASFAYLDKNGECFLPLYNYLKPYPPVLQKKFYNDNGGENLFALQTATPVLGSLNSGLQLYRLKYEKPGAFAKIKYALHLPQYLSYLLCNSVCTDITSIGCHTALWDFENNEYHKWVKKEGIEEKLPPIKNTGTIAGYTSSGIPVGTGLHDSSAALIPYLASFTEPFILLSTGTWSISLNPFNHSPLSGDELKQDCLCYLSYEGKPIKASRLFAGYQHNQQAKRLSEHFKTAPDQYKHVSADPELIKKMRASVKNGPVAFVDQFKFETRNLSEFNIYKEAYHRLMADIIEQQLISTNLVLKGTPATKIYVDGGFSNNLIYMHLLASAFSGMEVYAASTPQASALGAALALHSHWNGSDLPGNLIALRSYSAVQEPR